MARRDYERTTPSHCNVSLVCVYVCIAQHARNVYLTLAGLEHQTTTERQRPRAVTLL